MTIDIVLRVNDARTEVLLVRLTLEDLLLDGTRSDEAVHEAWVGARKRESDDGEAATTRRETYSPSSDHHARLEQELACRKQGSNLPYKRVSA